MTYAEWMRDKANTKTADRVSPNTNDTMTSAGNSAPNSNVTYASFMAAKKPPVQQSVAKNTSQPAAWKPLIPTLSKEAQTSLDPSADFYNEYALHAGKPLKTVPQSAYPTGAAVRYYSKQADDYASALDKVYDDHEKTFKALDKQYKENKINMRDYELGKGNANEKKIAGIQEFTSKRSAALGNAQDYANLEKRMNYEKVKDNKDYDIFSTMRMKKNGLEDKIFALEKTVDLTKNIGGFGGFVDDPREGLGEEIKSKSTSLFLTDDERGVYNYYIQKGQKDKAEEYYNAIKRDAQRRRAAYAEGNIYDMAKESRLGGALTNVVSYVVPDPGIISSTMQMFTGGSKPLNTDTVLFDVSRAKNASLQGTTEGMNPVAKAATEFGLNAAANVVNAVLYKGATPAMMATSAASSGAYDSGLRGGNAFQSTINGTLQGIAEYAGEKYSIGKFLDAIDTKNFKSIGKFGKNLTSSFITNASEEMNTKVAQNISDIVTMGDKSHFMKYYNGRVAEGESRTKAKDMALTKFFGLDVINAGIQGGFTGAGLGSISYASNLNRTKQTGQALQPTLPKLVTNGLNFHPNTAVYSLASDIAQRMTEGGKVSNIDIGRLYQNTVTETAAEMEKAGAHEKVATPAAYAATNASLGIALSERDADAILSVPQAVDYLNRKTGAGVDTTQPKTAQIARLATLRANNSVAAHNTPVNGRETAPSEAQNAPQSMLNTPGNTQQDRTNTSQQYKQSKTPQYIPQNTTSNTINQTRQDTKSTVLPISMTNKVMRNADEGYTDDIEQSNHLWRGSAMPDVSSLTLSSDNNLPSPISQPYNGVLAGAQTFLEKSNSTRLTSSINRPPLVNTYLDATKPHLSTNRISPKNDSVNTRNVPNNQQNNKNDAVHRSSSSDANDSTGSFGEMGKRAFRNSYQTDVNPQDYFGGFVNYYEAGRAGKPLEGVTSRFSASLTNAQKYAAYSAGTNDRTAETQRIAKQNSIIAAAQELYVRAIPKQEELNATLAELSDRLGLQGYEGSQKSVQSMVNKVLRKASDGYTVEDMKDHIRGVLFVNDYAELPDVLRALAEKNIPFRTENFFESPTAWGYKGYHITYNAGGVNAEIQIATKEAWAVKKQSDALYEKWRNVTNVSALSSSDLMEMKKDQNESLGLWQTVHSEGIDNLSSASVDNILESANSSKHKGVTGFTHLPSTSSSKISPDGGLVSKMRPVSVTEKRVNATKPPLSTNRISQKRGSVNTRNVPNIQNSTDNDAVRRSTSRKANDPTASFGEMGKRAFEKLFSGESNNGIALGGLTDYYEAGRAGKPMADVKSQFSASLTDAQIYAAYSAGLNDRLIALKKSGFIENEYSRGVNSKTKALLNKVGIALGKKIVFTEATPNYNGYYLDGVIYIAKNARNPILVVAKHEITHAMKQDSPAEFEAYKDFVIRTLKQNGVDVEAEINTLVALYGKNQIKLSRDDAEEELVSNFTEHLFDHPDEFKSLVGEERNLAEKALHLLRKFIKRMQQLFGGAKSSDMSLDQLIEAEKLWAKAFEAGKGKNSESTVKSVAKYSINENLLQQLQNWLAGKMNTDEYFTLGTTPESLTQFGAKPLPVVMDQDVIVKITNGYHNIALDEIAKLPDQIAKPVMLFKGSVPNSFIVLTEMVDKSGDEVITAIHLNRLQKRMSINRISSLYGKKNIDNYVMTNIQNNNLVDLDKEKGPAWFTNRGLQLPKLVQTIIKSKDSLSLKNDSVNTYHMQNSEKDTPKKYSLKTPIPEEIDTFVEDAFSNPKSNNDFFLGEVSQADNNAINRLSRTHTGKYTGSERKITQRYIRHVMEEHSDPVKEALRAQLPVTKQDIKLVLLAMKEKNSRIVRDTISRKVQLSVVSKINVDDFTLFVEEIIPQLDGKYKFEGRTIYKVPSSMTAAVLPTSDKTVLRNRRVAPNYSIPQNTKNATMNFIKTGDGVDAVLYFKSINGHPIVHTGLGGLIFISSYENTIRGIARGKGTISQAKVKMSNPYYLTPQNPLFRNSTEQFEKVNVAQKISELRQKGYDGIIFHNQPGDNYAVMVFHKSQIVPVEN